MYKALILDDEKPVRIAIEKLGEWNKYNIDTILTASNGREGLTIMRTEEPEYIFMDIHMPIMNGLEFLETAKEEYPCSQFIIVSGYDDFSYAQKAIRYGASDYLLKPISASDINNALKKATEKLFIALEKAEQTLQKDMLIESESYNNNGKTTPEQIAEIIHDYIETHYAESIKISMFSDKFFFSKEYISRQFKARYSYGIYEYVLHIRMEKAAILLKNDSIKIQDVGIQVGFTDNNHFSKAFKNYYNMSPSEYRNQSKLI